MLVRQGEVSVAGLQHTVKSEYNCRSGPKSHRRFHVCEIIRRTTYLRLQRQGENDTTYSTELLSSV